MSVKMLFDATAAASTLSKQLWPGASLAATLPAGASGNVANLSNTTPAVVGGVFAPSPHWNGVLLQFAGVGAADLSPAVEIGRFDKTGTLVTVLATATLKSITTSGTVTANTNPFTGDAYASTTFRLFDLVTLTKKCQLGQVATNVGGAEDDTPSEVYVSADEAKFYYVLVTSLGTMTRVICGLSPIPRTSW